ncbi:hypothetical protein B0186_11470, partial [Canicola haemoglobinophilus]
MASNTKIKGELVIKTNFKLLALTAAVGVALSGVAVAKSVDTDIAKAGTGNSYTKIFEKAGKELQDLADRSKQNEEDIAELQNAMDEVENVAAENTLLKEYVDISIASIQSDNDAIFKNFYSNLDALRSQVNNLDPTKVSEMVGQADSRLSVAENDILGLQGDVEKNLGYIAKN